MSVNVTINLPDETGTSWVAQLPLHGNGLSHARYQQLLRVDNTGDATGGWQRIHVNLSKEFSHLLCYASAKWIQPAGFVDTNFRMDMKCSPYEFYTVEGVASTIDIGYGGTSQASALWTPPATLCRNDDITPEGAGDSGRFTIYSPNVDTQVMRIDLQLLQFEKRCYEAVPYAELLAPLVRGSNLISS